MMRSLCAAMQLLTTIPLLVATTKDDSARSAPWFPLVGGVIGGLLALVGWGIVTFELPPLLGATLLTLALMVLTGGLHLDGMADSCDGLFSHRAPERMLAIMRDSTIGTMGVLGLLSVLLLKIIALSELVTHTRFLAILVLVPLLSRGVMTLALMLLPQARSEGMASHFAGHQKGVTIVLSVVIMLGSGWFLMSLMGLIFILCSCIIAFVWNLFVLSKIGGITGDTVGATVEIVESLLLVCAVVL